MLGVPVQIRASLGQNSRLFLWNIGCCCSAVFELGSRCEGGDARRIFNSCHINCEVRISFGIEAKKLGSASFFGQIVKEFMPDPRQFGLCTTFYQRH